jgi:hypothetical protein
MTKATPAPIERLYERIGRLDRQQILAWQKMAPAERLEVAFQAYQFALEAVRLTERRSYPDLTDEQFNWRVTRRMQGNQKLGREPNRDPNQPSGT